MKLIAHRGASLECQECTLESLVCGSRLGADVVECDPRRTADGKIVIFHDDDLKRLAGDPRTVISLKYDEMKASLEKAGLTLTTLDEVIENYHEDAAILLDFTMYVDDAMFERLSKVPQKIICGIHAVSEAACASKYFPPEQILAFMPKEDMYEDFHKAGAGIIRLWETWLCRVTPQDVKAKCDGAEVFIMAKQPATDMNGSPESLRRLEKLGADGVLLNNIRMGAAVIKERREY